MAELFTSDNIISFFVLALLEIVLGIDNVIFVSIIMSRLKKEDKSKARVLWMIFGIATRTALLFALSWLLSQKGKPLFTIPFIDKPIDLASLIMLLGGLFLLFKTVKEIHHKLEGDEDGISNENEAKLNFGAGMFQIVMIDMVFSFDSIITAGGTAKVLAVMIAAVVLAMCVMFFFAPKISDFIHKHPTLKMLAMSFLVMIGLILIVEGWDSEKAHELHLKNYVYFGMAFSFGVEMLNMLMRKKSNKKPVELNEPTLKDDAVNVE
jgi:predicted tellurium resistance membrane protein TerC